MKLEFIDELSEDDITLDLGLKFKDSIPKTTHSLARIKWSLIIKAETWGLDSFDFQLSSLEMPIIVDLFKDNKKIASEKLTLEVKPDEKNKLFRCRIYKDFIKDNKYKEQDLVSVPINFFVLEKPQTRRTTSVKHIDIDIFSSNKKITLTI